MGRSPTEAFGRWKSVGFVPGFLDEGCEDGVGIVIHCVLATVVVDLKRRGIK